jgi:hypothetical protein
MNKPYLNQVIFLATLFIVTTHYLRVLHQPVLYLQAGE